MNVRATSRADLHCHSTASQLSKLGVQRALGLPECATPPEEVYELAKRRGMDFVTITDHDTIAGVQQIADRPDVFVSEELTAWFKGEAQAVHVLCYGITADDHEWLQAHADDVEEVAEYLHDHEIACALAHPFYAVEAPLTPRHRRRLAQLFGVWETRNGSRARELNAPAAVYIETHGGTGVAGSDDHAGVDIGRTFTETPVAHTWHELLAHVRAGRASARGEQGSAAKWAHSAMALAVRALGRGEGGGAVDPRAVLTMVERVMREGDVRRGAVGADLGPDDARALLHAWLDAIDLRLDEARPARPPAARGLQPRRPLPPRPARARAQARRRGRRRSGRHDDRRATSAPPRRASSTPASRPSRTRPRPPSSAARRASSSSARATRSASRSWPTPSAACTASPTRSTRSASAGCPASRSRSSAPTPTSTAG